MDKSFVITPELYTHTNTHSLFSLVGTFVYMALECHLTCIIYTTIISKWFLIGEFLEGHWMESQAAWSSVERDSSGDLGSSGIKALFL